VSAGKFIPTKHSLIFAKKLLITLFKCSIQMFNFEILNFCNKFIVCDFQRKITLRKTAENFLSQREIGQHDIILEFITNIRAFKK